ncbi:LacI family transcriptional regulator [Antribacter sp. KLBMP9083]|uniref:LacI family transcriptional regulator n=1 Tax=Antribacter soli TaxID=2910976 RepID=A0AA41QD10_9MICO|nr:LacI family DNA-binding transcriptional regulator [Antribacter soli]MCF4119904.1 LacI family transcriptional regulator [Antribacter soli]
MHPDAGRTRAVDPEPRVEAAEGAQEPATRASAGARPATIYDVATMAGVSHQTVSRYLKGYEGIRPETRERVVQALDALDYRPNLTARTLTTGRSHRIGALTHELDQFGPSRIVQGAAAAAREAGYLLDIVTLDMSDARAIAKALSLVRQHDLAGILAFSSTDEMTRAFEAADFKVPVYLGTEEDDAFSDRSELTSVGIPALVGHLAELGHRRVLHVAGPSRWAAARNRARAFEVAVDAHGMRSTGVIHGDWSARSGHEAIAGLPGERLDFTAVVAANDQMALGVMLALAERGLRVPEDVSVTGVDDIPEAAYFSPPLTTLSVDFVEQGRVAFQQLLGRVVGTPPPDAVALPSHLVVRRSTAAAARSLK